MERNTRFAFTLFSLLSVSSFLCALMATVLSQLVKRQLSLTQTQEDHTAHEFAARFGLYIRLTGGLNSFAGIFFATAIFHFLLSIYNVPLYLALMLAMVWLIGGTLVIESFISMFGHWTLAEVFDDLGEVVDSPTVYLSSSPVTGSLQIAGLVVMGIFRKSATKLGFLPQRSQ